MPLTKSRNQSLASNRTLRQRSRKPPPQSTIVHQPRSMRGGPVCVDHPPLPVCEHIQRAGPRASRVVQRGRWFVPPRVTALHVLPPGGMAGVYCGRVAGRKATRPGSDLTLRPHVVSRRDQAKRLGWPRDVGPPKTSSISSRCCKGGALQRVLERLPGVPRGHSAGVIRRSIIARREQHFEWGAPGKGDAHGSWTATLKARLLAPSRRLARGNKTVSSASLENETTRLVLTPSDQTVSVRSPAGGIGTSSFTSL
jgi:hypothetical protein